MYVAKTKALISFTVTAKLICVFVFAYANHWFSRDAAQMSENLRIIIVAFVDLNGFYFLHGINSIMHVSI